MKYLPYEDWLDVAKELEPGVQVNINHTNCEAGFDTKRRLYIKRGKKDGLDIYLCFCHHCGGSGSWRSAVPNYTPPNQTHIHNRTGAGSSFNGKFIHDYTNNQRDWSREARSWINRYGITALEVQKYCIGYSRSQDSVLLPVFRGGQLIGYQSRYTGVRGRNASTRPKYETRTACRPLFWSSADYASVDVSQGVVLTAGSPAPATTNEVVLVEDMLSGIKCSRVQPAVAILGASINDAHVAYLVTLGYTRFTVFLDDDNRQVRLNQVKILNTLSQYGEARLITGIGQDPKQLSTERLRSLLT